MSKSCYIYSQMSSLQIIYQFHVLSIHICVHSIWYMSKSCSIYSHMSTLQMIFQFHVLSIRTGICSRWYVILACYIWWNIRWYEHQKNCDDGWTTFAIKILGLKFFKNIQIQNVSFHTICCAFLVNITSPLQFYFVVHLGKNLWLYKSAPLKDKIPSYLLCCFISHNASRATAISSSYKA